MQIHFLLLGHHRAELTFLSDSSSQHPLNLVTNFCILEIICDFRLDGISHRTSNLEGKTQKLQQDIQSPWLQVLMHIRILCAACNITFTNFGLHGARLSCKGSKEAIRSPDGPYKIAVATMPAGKIVFFFSFLTRHGFMNKKSTRNFHIISTTFSSWISSSIRGPQLSYEQ